jgi:hypothetical protein
MTAHLALSNGITFGQRQRNKGSRAMDLCSLGWGLFAAMTAVAYFLLDYATKLRLKCQAAGISTKD